MTGVVGGGPGDVGMDGGAREVGTIEGEAVAVDRAVDASTDADLAFCFTLAFSLIRATEAGAAFLPGLEPEAPSRRGDALSADSSVSVTGVDGCEVGSLSLSLALSLDAFDLGLGLGFSTSFSLSDSSIGSFAFSLPLVLLTFAGLVAGLAGAASDPCGWGESVGRRCFFDSAFAGALAVEGVGGAVGDLGRREVEG